MQQARVCHITSAHSRNDVRIFQKECTSLAKNGYEVYLVAPGKSGKENGVMIAGFGEKEKNRWKRMFLSSGKAYRLAKGIDADIYHFHDPELLPYGYLLKRSGKKVIFDSHENLFLLMQEKSYIPPIARQIFGKFFVVCLKCICKKFDAVISVDPQICRNYKKINKNTAMVANFPIYRPIPQDCGKNRMDIAFAGGVDQQWNHAAIIKAMEKLGPEVTYTVCGNGDDKYLGQLKRLPCWKQVCFKGMVPHEEALQMLRRSRIGVALCNYSGNSNQKKGTLGNTKLFETMMAGIPVICTRFELWEKIVRKYHCGICVDNPQDSEEISEAIAYLLSHPKEAEEMGKNGKRIVMQKFNWESEEKKLLKLYSELAEELQDRKSEVV